MSKSRKTARASLRPGEGTPPGFPVVGVGASAGGLEALALFLSHLKPDCGAAFVVVSHLDPERKGMMPELLQRSTSLPVVEAGDRMTIEVNSIYVIPSNKFLSLVGGRLQLTNPPEPRGLRLPIDYFLRALADECRDRAIAVILSGMGSDGTLGAAAVKEHAGLVVVQDPASAKFDSMPRSIIASGLADIIATAEELPQRIAAYLEHVPNHDHRNAAGDHDAAPRDALAGVLLRLREHTGHDFSQYKMTTVCRRIERRMGIYQLASMEAYAAYLSENRQEIDLLFKELLIGVTSFFRDGEAWQCFQNDALPALLAEYPAGKVLRAWIPGCSTGEEAYSLAIAFREVVEQLPPPARYSLQIFATDLDTDALQRARQALYPANIAADVSPQRLARYFVEEHGRYQVAKKIREMIVFAPQNLTMDPPFTKLDILCCRNLLIYLGPDLQKRLVPLFHYSLRPGGVLFLGSAETVGPFAELFAPIDAKSKLFVRTNSRAANVEFPSRYEAAVARKDTAGLGESDSVSLQALFETTLLRQFVPPSVLVNGEGDILYIGGRTGRYLEPAAGKANWNIHAMAREGLREELLIALPKALRTRERITRHVAPMGDQRVDLIVQPLEETRLAAQLLLIIFAELPAAPPATRAVTDTRAARPGSRVAELEAALQQAREEVQSAREEMQTSREELKSTNEELQSTNEELQSTNEELTTSKEEMQSLNEELQTVNSELQSKVDELSAANNDMKNLLNSTDLATVFLDEALHVRRFTSPATRIFKLIPGDVGRPLSDIVNDLDYGTLEEDGHEVLRTLEFCEKEVRTHDGRLFLIKIMPYRTLANVVDGLVLTFTDFSVAKRLEARLRDNAATPTEP